MQILLISTDLLIQSRVSAAATRRGFAPPGTSSADAVPSREDLADCGIVILDLSAPGLDVARAVPALRERLPESAPIIAFAPHVHTAKLAAAREAGCDQVLSRGQIDREIDAILQKIQVRGETF